MNGYSSDRERRPASEQMVDLHIYLVPPDIWREKYHNALNQNINETVSLGFIRVHPETKIYALRDEIDRQLGDQEIPREYVFVKSVGRSLTRLKSRQETTLKVKNFLPPQAYAPELYLLEATPEVRQQIAASSENSTRPQSRTSYDYEFMQRQRFTPDTYRENEPLDRRKADNDENDRLKAPSPDGNKSDRLNRSQDDNDMSDWERQRREEEEQARREEEERRRREAEEAMREEQERENIAEQAKLMKTNSDQELTRYPSPPPLRLASPDRDTASARARRKKQKEELLRELEEAREARRASERQREELVRHAKQMQTKTQNRRNHARDLWKKRYFEEKKKTGPLEEQCNRLRHELDIIHKKLLTTLEGPREKATKLNDIKPSNKVGSPGRPVNNFKIQATRLQHEIEDIRRRVDHAKMKLTSEMKLRNQAETELRALRAELTQKKINLTLSRNSHLTTYAPPAADVNLISARTGITPRS